ncbi:MAG: hypothetical protein K0R14_169 [Burkholderiales bacterium]|jgi:hypothetical protein|nr:hypothetical protein [Burkholderiales bacterium]
MFLVTGIVNKLSINKRSIKEEYNLKHVTLALEREININKYDLTIDKEQYIWQLKPDNLNGDDLVPFLQAQYSMYDPERALKLNEEIAINLKGKLKNEILQMTENGKGFSRCAKLIHINHYIRIPEISFNSIEIDYELLTFFVDGKIIMECYDNILFYFERLIRLQVQNYPIADCVKVAITS